MGKKGYRIGRELPPVGTKLSGKFRGVVYMAEIVGNNTKPGLKAIEFSGVKYYSMTAAAKAITKQPVNGWRFWKIQKEG